MIKGYQGNELWTAVNPATGNVRSLAQRASSFPAETIAKLYYCKRVDEYVTIPGISLFKVAAVGRIVENLT